MYSYLLNVKIFNFTTNFHIVQKLFQMNETVIILQKLSNYDFDEDLREQVNNYNKILIILCVILLALWKFGHLYKFYRMIT